MKWPLPSNVHPLLVHFPIALFYAAGFFFLIGCFCREVFYFRMARGLLYAGTLGALAAVGSGLWDQAHVGYAIPVGAHKRLGLTTAITAVLVSALQFLYSQGGGTKREIYFSLMGYVTLCALVALTADRGGDLVYQLGVGVRPESFFEQKLQRYQRNLGKSPSTKNPQTPNRLLLEKLQQETALPREKIKTLYQQGRFLYHEFDCTTCHGDAPGTGINIPPILSYEGDRVRWNWLVDYLRDPYPLRYARDNVRSLERMPNYRLTPWEAQALSVYLLGRRRPDLFSLENAFSSSLASSPTPQDILSGKEIFDLYNCTGCHTLGSYGGRLGPDLSHAGSRLKPTFLYSFLENPQKIIPHTPMKNPHLWKRELVPLVHYLSSLK